MYTSFSVKITVVSDNEVITIKKCCKAIGEITLQHFLFQRIPIPATKKYITTKWHILPSITKI